MTGQRPVIVYTNGFEHWIWDDAGGYPPRDIHGFYTHDELQLFVQRRQTRQSLVDSAIDSDIVERHYQHRAIRAIDDSFTAKRRQALRADPPHCEGERPAGRRGRIITVVTMQDRLDNWEHRAEWPLAAVAVVFLAAYSIQVLVQPQGVAAHAVVLATWLSWAVFTADYAARLYLAPDRKRWFLRHLADLAVVLLPLLRPLRLLRLIVLIGVMQKAVGNAIRGRVIIYTISGAVLLVYVASLSALQAERGAPGAHIVNFGDAVWWAVTTITTVGYGDMYPVTTTGRVIAALLMIGGISLVGLITATIASWIVQTVAVDDAAAAAATAEQINELRDEILLLREELRRAAEIREE